MGRSSSSTSGLITAGAVLVAGYMWYRGCRTLICCVTLALLRLPSACPSHQHSKTACAEAKRALASERDRRVSAENRLSNTSSHAPAPPAASPAVGASSGSSDAGTWPIYVQVVGVQPVRIAVKPSQVLAVVVERLARDASRFPDLQCSPAHIKLLAASGAELDVRSSVASVLAPNDTITAAKVARGSVALPSLQLKPYDASRDLEDFVEFSDRILDDLFQELDDFEMPAMGQKYVRKMTRYTTIGGKMNRGRDVVTTVRNISNFQGNEFEPVTVFRARVAGWCVEFLQAFFLVADDIMDGSITRRRQPCWYRKQNVIPGMPVVGDVAINDAFILESHVHRMLLRYFSDQPYYTQLVDLFHVVTYQTELGQCMDLLSAPPEGIVNLDNFTIDVYKHIVKYKTAYYTYYLPIAIGMLMTGVTNKGTYKAAERLCIEIGEYFQVQDDFLDCYADPKHLGKIGTDIQDNKCGWLVVQALQRVSPDQRAVLAEHYGVKGDTPEETARHEAAVKALYRELNMEAVYNEYRQGAVARIQKLIDEWDETAYNVPRSVFRDAFARIEKRNM